jgi:hypothetical protein
MARPWRSEIAEGAARGLRWLRADLGDVVDLRRRSAAAQAPPDPELRAGLDRWSGRLSRSRAYVVARRWLLAGLVVAIVPGLVILAAGAGRPWWLIAVVLIGPLAGVVALTRRPSPLRTARLLDRDLGLADRLTTGLELQAAGAPPTGLGGLVVDEAAAALGGSFGGVRAVGRRSSRELAWLLVAALALALVIALPRSSGSHAASKHASASTQAAAGAGAAAPGHGQSTGRHPAAPPLPLPLPSPSIPKSLASAPTGTNNPSADPYGGRFQGGHLDAKVQPGKPSASTSGLSLPSPGSSAGPQAAAGGQSSGNSPAAAGSGSGAGANPARRSAGSLAAPTATSSSAAHHGAASGTQSGRGGQAGGESAGSLRAPNSNRTGLVPALGGDSGLPLQAGLAGARARRSGARGEVTNTPNGGGGYAQPANSSSGGTGSSGLSLPVIAPTFNSPSQPQSGLLLRYFGDADQLVFKGW